jgi:hypothetical protein
MNRRLITGLQSLTKPRELSVTSDESDVGPEHSLQIFRQQGDAMRDGFR